MIGPTDRFLFLSYKGGRSGGAEFTGRVLQEVASRHILESQSRARAHEGNVRPMEFPLKSIVAPGKQKLYGVRFIDVFRVNRLKIIACDKRGRGVEINTR